MATVRIGGGEALDALAKRLQKAGNSDMVIQTIGEALDATFPDIEKAVARGTERLPQRGGLAAQVAKTRIGRKTTRRNGYYLMRVIAHPNAVKDPGAIDRGRVAHQAWGRWTKPLLIQTVPKSWFSEPIRDLTPVIRRRAAAALQRALGKV